MMVPTRLAAMTIVGLAPWFAAPAAAETPRSPAMVITCTNPVSDATWPIRIDYDQATTDSNSAQIGDAAISWHDATHGGNDTLDGRSGQLTIIMPSSAGGYFLHDQCRLPSRAFALGQRSIQGWAA